jgi:hypothetical protein
MNTHSSAGPPVGLSERLKELEQEHNHAALPAFDLDAAITGGRRRRRRRNAAQVLATTATLAVIAIAVSLSPVSDRVNGQGRVVPASPAAPTLPAGVGGDRLDTAKIVHLEATPARLTELRYEHVACDATEDAAVKADSGIAICTDSEASATSDPLRSQAQFAPDVIILGSEGLATFLRKPSTPGTNWSQLPEARRHITPAQLRAYLDSKSSSDTLFRLHFNAEAQIDTIEEIYEP